MPTQLPCPRPRSLYWALAVSLTVALFAPAKPPDLPLPVQVEAVPADGPASPMPILDAILSETVRPAGCDGGHLSRQCAAAVQKAVLQATQLEREEQSEPAGRSMADRCAAMRTLTRCVLFSCHPLTALMRLKPVVNFDEEAPFPVVHAGSVTISVKEAVRGTALAVTAGPFCPLWKSNVQAYKIVPSAGTGIQNEATNALEGATDCEYPKCITNPSLAGADEEAENTNTAEEIGLRLRDYMIAAEIYGHMGFVGEACRYYEKVSKLCPDSCMACEAEARLVSLRAGMYGTAKAATTPAKTQATQTCPYKPASIKRIVEPVDVTNSVLEKLQHVERASELYTEAETLMHEGELEKARKMYEEICTLCPGHRFADMATDRLSHLKGLTAGAEEQEKTPSKPSDPDGARACPKARPGMIQRTFQISEFANSQKKIDALIGCIRETIRPQSWDVNGGQGAIDYFPLGTAIVVRNDAAVQEQVANLLEGLRYLSGIRQMPCGQLLTDKHCDETKAMLKDPCFPCKQHTRATAEEASEEQDVETPAGEPKVVLSFMGYDLSNVLTTYAVAWDRKTDKLSVQRVQDVEAVDEIVRLICKGIEPKTWYVNGGTGTIEYNAELKTLFVRQTEEVHEAIAAFLAAREKEIELRKENTYRAVKRARTKAGQAKPASRKKTVPNTDGGLLPRMPAVDANIVRAYNEILGLAPARLILKVHETNSNDRPAERLSAIPRLYVDEEECDCKPGDACLPSICVDVKVMRDTGALRVRGQMQVGPFTFSLLRDPKCGGTFTASLKLCASETEASDGPMNWLLKWAFEQPTTPTYDRIHGGIE